MKALRFLRALPLALLLIAPARADQGTIVGPIVGPKTMTEVMTTVNAALLAIQSCNSGVSAPANGPGGLPKAFQCWADTSAAPVITYKTYDGASWVAFGKLNTSTHIWTPVYQGTDAGTASTATTGTSGHTLGFLDGANTWSAVQSFNSAMLSLKGSTSGAGTLNAPAIASTYVWTLPALTDTLVGKATTDILTNKTFDTAATGNSFSINGLAATANTGTGSVVRATSPTLVTPTIGAATATSINGNIWTAGTGTFTLGAGKTATISNTLTFAGTDGSTVTLGAGGTVAYLANTLNAFAATTSAQLAAVISDETGSGALVFGTSPVLVTPNLGTPSAVNLSNATAMPLSGVTGLGTGVATALATPSSANLRAAITDETGTGSAVFGTSPNITTPTGIVKGDVGLGNVDNTSDATKNAATATLTNKTLTAPIINSPTGIVKGDVGLGNVDNTSDVNKPVSTAQAAADALKVNLTRNVLTGCGLAGGGDLSADRTLRLSLTINAQTGTSYSVQDSDCGKLVSLNNASAVAVTLPQANGSTFVSGWSVAFQNKGAGLVTVTPTTSTINGGASISLSQNQGMHCDSDGANYTCVLGVGAGGGSGTVTSVICFGTAITASGTCVTTGQIPGIASNTAASTGNIGEYISSNVSQGSPVSLVNNVAKDITTVSLGAGDWTCHGNADWINAAGTLVGARVWISTTANTLPATPNAGSANWWVGSVVNPQISNQGVVLPAGEFRVLVNTTTTVSLGSFASFTGAMSTYGFIGCRRMR